MEKEELCHKGREGI